MALSEKEQYLKDMDCPVAALDLIETILDGAYDNREDEYSSNMSALSTIKQAISAGEDADSLPRKWIDGSLSDNLVAAALLDELGITAGDIHEFMDEFYVAEECTLELVCD